MSTDKVFIRDILVTISKYKWKILLMCVVCVGFSIQTTNWMKKQYKANFEINVYSKYFQNPLISTIVPGVYNIPEMRFTIDSMVKEAISDEFIDSLAEEFNIYKIGPDESANAKARMYLRSNFAYYSTGGQSYEVAFTFHDQYVAKKVAEKTFQRVKGHFIDSRIATIELVKEIMVKKLNSMSATQRLAQKGSEKVLASKSPDVMKAELLKINADIAALNKQYNDVHPKIVALKQRKNQILDWLKEYEGDVMDVAPAQDEPQMNIPTDKSLSSEISGKFYTKYQDFAIALEIEKQSLESYIGVIKRPQLPTEPVWPKKRLFASVGFILGLVLSFLYVFISEILKPNKQESVYDEARGMRTIVLGELPYLTKRVTENTIKQLPPYHPSEKVEVWSQ